MICRILSVREIDCRLAFGRHRREAPYRTRINRLFARRKAATPSLYDGETVLSNRWRIAGGRLEIDCQRIRYAGLLHWLSTGRRQVVGLQGGTVHFFAVAVVIASDGRVLLGRMGPSTANAGKVYMPSGSMELEDFAGARGDLEANMAREVMEETGIDLGAARAAQHFKVFAGQGVLTVFREYRLPLGSEELLASVRAHIAAGKDEEEELAEILTAGPGEMPAGIADHVRAYLGRFSG